METPEELLFVDEIVACTYHLFRTWREASPDISMVQLSWRLLCAVPPFLAGTHLPKVPNLWVAELDCIACGASLDALPDQVW